MCIPGDHGAPFVSPIRRSYPIRDSVQHLQTASVSYCAIPNCASCSHRSPRIAANRAFHLAIYLPACDSISSPLIISTTSLPSFCFCKSKSIHLLLTLLLLLCWRLTCVNSDSELPIMKNSSFHSHLGLLSDPELTNHEHEKDTSPRSTASGSSRPTVIVTRPQKFTPLYFRQRVLRRTTRNRHTVRKRSASGGATAFDNGNVVVQLLNPALIQFICSRLPDPCARAAYLREHVRHELCLEIPLLYVLPNTTTTFTTRSKMHDNVTLHFQPIDLYAPQSGSCQERTGYSLTYLSSDSLFEVFLSSPQTCSKSLTEANREIRDRLEPMFNDFDRLLDKSFCRRQSDPDLNVTGEFQCDECREAYRNWLCTTVIQPAFPLQMWPPEEKPRPRDSPEPPLADSPVSPYPSTRHIRESMGTSSNSILSNPQSAWSDQTRSSVSTTSPASVGSHGSKLHLKKYTSRRQYRLVNVEPCVSWCTVVETLCPYFNPADLTANGGEPAFLCDEGHYHHSSRYQMIYRPNQQCETECCYSKSDMRSGSYSVMETSDPTGGASIVQTASSLSRSSSTDVPFLSSSVPPMTAASETVSGDDFLNWPQADASLAKCESLQLRCTHHGYSKADNRHQMHLPISTSPLVTDSHQPTVALHPQPSFALPSNKLDQSSDLTKNRSLASISGRLMFSHLTVWTCVLPVLLYIWPAWFMVQPRLRSNRSQQHPDCTTPNSRLLITQPGSLQVSGLDQTSMTHLRRSSSRSIST